MNPNQHQRVGRSSLTKKRTTLGAPVEDTNNLVNLGMDQSWFHDQSNSRPIFPAALSAAMPLLSRVSALAGHWPATWPLPVELCHPWVKLHPGMGAWLIFRVEWACWPVPSCTIPYLSWTGCFCFWPSGSKEKQETGSQKAATGMFWHEGEPVPSPSTFCPVTLELLCLGPDSTPALYQNLEWIPTSLSLRPPLWGWSWGCCLGRCKSLIDPGWVGAARRQRETLDWPRFLHDFQIPDDFPTKTVRSFQSRHPLPTMPQPTALEATPVPAGSASPTSTDIGAQATRNGCLWNKFLATDGLSCVRIHQKKQKNYETNSIWSGCLAKLSSINQTSGRWTVANGSKGCLTKAWSKKLAGCHAIKIMYINWARLCVNFIRFGMSLCFWWNHSATKILWFGIMFHRPLLCRYAENSWWKYCKGHVVFLNCKLHLVTAGNQQNAFQLELTNSCPF